MTLFVASETWPFAFATLIIVIIAVIEGLALLVGASVAGWLDALLHHTPTVPEGAPDSWLGWLHIGRVPVIVLLIVYLTLFALIGFALNAVAFELFRMMVPVLIACPIAAIAALPLMRSCATVIARVVPREESFAVSLDSLVGRVAVIVSGTARTGYPAEGKVVSENGQTHYVMVEPDTQDVTFARHDSVLLVRRVAGTRFRAIPNPRPGLL